MEPTADVTESTSPSTHHDSLEAGHFRLLQLVKGDGILGCRLRVHDLSTTPVYTAVSYTWGSAEEPQFVAPDAPYHDGPFYVDLSNQSMEITANLSDLLQELRTFQDYDENGLSTRYYWIDALCIDQQNDNERTQQVNMMGQIYARADEVFIWLGKANQRTPKVHHMVEQLGKVLERPDTADSKAAVYTRLTEIKPLDLDDLEWLGLDPSTSWYDWYALIVFYSRRWFKRVWTIQEVALSRNIAVRCGQYNFSWFSLTECATVILVTGLVTRVQLAKDRRLDLPTEGISVSHGHRLAMDYVGMKQTDSDLGESPSNILWSGQANQLLCSTMLMFQITVNSRSKGSADARDKVFAFLGLWSKLAELYGHPQPSMTADYHKTADEVYTEFMTILLSESGSLNLLSSVQRRSIESLPSWVADLSTRSGSSIIEILFLRLWSPEKIAAWQNCPACPEGFQIQGTQLHIYSTTFSTVSHVGNSEQQHCAGNFDRTVHLLLASPETNPDGHSRMKSFWRSLSIDPEGTRPQSKPSMFHNSMCGIFYADFLTAATKDPPVTRSAYLSGLNCLDTLSVGEDAEYIPSVSGLMAFFDDIGVLDSKIELKEAAINAWVLEVNNFRFVAKETWDQRLPFLLDSGHFGVTTDTVKPGDTLRILPGARAPFVFRKVDGPDDQHDYQKLVGEAYVSGIMAGEGAEYLRQRGETWKKICVI